MFCEPDEIALGGGATAAGPGKATLRRSQPIFVGTTATGWDAIALQDAPGTIEVTVFAICAKPVIPPNG